MSSPKKIQRTKWYQEKNFRGSYSYRGLKAFQHNITNSDLAAPLKNSNGKPVIFFAGEATHNEYYSSLHGAVESGWRAAMEIMTQENSTR